MRPVVGADSVNALKVDPARRFQWAEAFAMPVAPPFSLQQATFAVASEDVRSMTQFYNSGPYWKLTNHRRILYTIDCNGSNGNILVEAGGVELKTPTENTELIDLIIACTA